jgi:hypothetical protein
MTTLYAEEKAGWSLFAAAPGAAYNLTSSGPEKRMPSTSLMRLR